MLPTKKILSILLAIAILVTIIAVAFGGYAIYINSKSLSSFSLNYLSKATITPKDATFNGFITSSGKDVSQLDLESEKKLTAMLDYLKNQGISESNITTNKSSNENYDYQPVINNGDTAAQEKTYRLNLNLKVKIDKIEENQLKAATIQSKLVELGINQFDRWEYDYQDNQNLEKVCYDLELKGIEIVQSRAKEKITKIGGSVQAFDFNSSYSQCVDPSNNQPMYKLDAATATGGSPENQVNKLLLTKRDVSVNVDLVAKYRI